MVPDQTDGCTVLQLCCVSEDRRGENLRTGVLAFWRSPQATVTGPLIMEGKVGGPVEPTLHQYHNSPHTTQLTTHGHSRSTASSHRKLGS